MPLPLQVDSHGAVSSRSPRESSPVDPNYLPTPHAADTPVSIADGFPDTSTSNPAIRDSTPGPKQNNHVFIPKLAAGRVRGGAARNAKQAVALSSTPSMPGHSTVGAWEVEEIENESTETDHEAESEPSPSIPSIGGGGDESRADDSTIISHEETLQSSPPTVRPAQIQGFIRRNHLGDGKTVPRASSIVCVVSGLLACALGAVIVGVAGGTPGTAVTVCCMWYRVPVNLDDLVAQVGMFGGLGFGCVTGFIIFARWKVRRRRLEKEVKTMALRASGRV